MMLEGRSFLSPDELLCEVNRVLREIPKDCLLNAYYEWMRRLKQCMKANGEYILT